VFPLTDGHFLVTEINGDWVDNINLHGHGTGQRTHRTSLTHRAGAAPSVNPSRARSEVRDLSAAS